MVAVYKTKTEERMAAIERKEKKMWDDRDAARKERSEQIGRLRALRLAKEVENSDLTGPAGKKPANRAGGQMPKAYRRVS